VSNQLTGRPAYSFDYFSSPTAARRIVSCLILLSVCLLISACGGTGLKNPENLCDIYQDKRGWYKASVNAEKKWGIPLQIPMAIIYQESSFKRRARPPRRWHLGFIPGKRASSAYGYAQVIDGTWSEYIRDTGEYWRKRNRFSDAVDFVNYYLTRATRSNGIKRTDAYNYYLNYHEGITGFRKKTWKGKGFLLRAAGKVRDRSERYRQQYQRCRDDLGKGWVRRLFRG